MIKVTDSVSFDKTEHFLMSNQHIDIDKYLKIFGEKGVGALAAATPKDTGLTAESWGYEITKGPLSTTITWTNSNVVDGWFNVALMIQYGHGTRHGVYVEGIDYINPALETVYTDLIQAIWEEVMDE